MVVHGKQRRPRVLLEDLPDDLATEIAPLFGSHRIVAREEIVDESEFDALVTTGKVGRSEHLHVLALACTSAGTIALHRQEPGTPIRPVRASVPVVKAKRVPASVFIENDVYAQQLDVPKEVTGSLRALVVETLLPACALEHPRPRWVARDSIRNERMPFVGSEPLLTTHKHDQVLAFTGTRWSHGGRGGLIVALPVIPASIEDWVRWFLDQARKATPEAFPLDLSWHEDPAWTPPRLRAALDRSSVIAQRKREMLAELEAAANAATAEVAAARDEASSSWWQLLTAQGEALVAAVMEALQTLKFDVKDSDANRAPNEPKMEDLRATDKAEAPGWVALVEIKGFKRGASPSGASQLMGRPVRAFVNEEARVPDTLWYIVNHLIDIAPGQRPIALSNDSVVDALAEQHGALIDTRDLLRAVLDVQRGEAQPCDVRDSMRAARGRWVWPHD